MFRALVVVALLPLLAGCAAVPANHVGVLESFGSIWEETWSPGLHLWGPWFGVHRINCRTTSAKETSATPTAEGLIVGLDVSVVFHFKPEGAKEIYGRYGGGQMFFEAVVEPEIRSAVRNATATFNAADLYSKSREAIAAAMLDSLRSKLHDRPVVIEALLLRDITLPEQLSNGIQAKLVADQEAQKMTFVLTKERQEAERKRIEAAGIRDFQAIVTQGIDERLLKWKGIEATEALAKSPNAKIVVIGAGKDGLPLILNQ